ncbi:YDL027C [Saccharomyces arboricola H-6]|uniref:YDL027C n=1 Tax=Saccharomyces arboricola (strain H-6 / AS 2.3317 / CBS 10644) TaxID=1160507 RepID=J8Q6S8_SACAR|nr:YDL027C [Saccharomyces arboricola H-6]
MFRLPFKLLSRTRVTTNNVPFNNTIIFNPRLLRQLRTSFKLLPVVNRPPAIIKLGIDSSKVYRRSLLSHSCHQYSSYPVPNPISSLFKLTNKRAFHSSQHAGMKFMFFSKSPKNGDEPLVKVYKVSPFLILFSAASLVTFTLTSTIVVIPFIFHFFFPLIITFIFYKQFKKWQKNIFYKDVLNSLPKTGLKITVPTMRSLQLQPMIQSWKEVSSRMGIPNEFSKGLNVDLVKQEETRKQFLSFLQKRVLESFTKNELGIRSYFLGDSVEKWIKESYDLELDIDNCRSELRKFQDSIFSIVRYRLYLDSMKNSPLNPSKKFEGKKHIADVYVIILDKSFPEIMFKNGGSSKADFFKILQESEIANSSKMHNMIIAIKSVNTPLSKHFVITANGDSGDFFSKYHVSTLDGDHTEYTLRE